jgi:hypothetical protein
VRFSLTERYNTASRTGIGITGDQYIRESMIAMRFRRRNMDAWKKAVVAGSIGAAAVLFLKHRYAAGVLSTGIGLAVLAAEYPEKFDRVRRALPDYFEKSMRIMEMAERAGRRIADQSTLDWGELGI